MKRWIRVIAATGILIVAAGYFFIFSAYRQERMYRHSAESLADRLAAELASMNDELENVKREGIGLRGKLDEALNENTALKDNLSHKTAELETMRGYIEKLKDEISHIDLGKVVVGKDSGIAANPGIASQPQNPEEGHVISLNQEFGFVIVSLGAEQGMKQGNVLTLFQDGEPAADLRIDMVDSAMSAAALLTKPKREVQPGDIVRFKKAQ